MSAHLSNAHTYFFCHLRGTFSRIATIALFVVLLVFGYSTSVAQAAGDIADNNDATTFLVHFDPTSTMAERQATLARLGVELVSWLPQIHVAEVRYQADSHTRGLNEETTATLVRLAGAAELGTMVQAIEENVLVTGADLPNDPALTSEERSYGLTVTHAPEGWDYTKGTSSVVVALIDTGLNLQHPEFAGRIVAGYDFINNDDDPTDDNGHGTHTAGIVGAGGDNGIGTVGVCPQCLIMPVKVLNQNNAGTWSSVAKGILYATDNGARIINLSLGAAVSSQTLENAIAYAQAHNVLIVAAAGNMGVERDFYPAALDGVMAVSATDARDRHWSLSNYGAYIDVAAPGYAIYSTYHDLNNYYEGYNYMSGTSMAAPFVAGLAGLLLSQDTERTPTDLQKLITLTADKLSSNVDDLYFGHGRINVARALAVGSDAQWTQVVEGERTDGVSTDGDVLLPNQLFLPIVVR